MSILVKQWSETPDGIGLDVFHGERKFAGDCLASARDQALQWLGANEFVFDKAEMDHGNRIEFYVNIHDQTIYATLEEI